MNHFIFINTAKYEQIILFIKGINNLKIRNIYLLKWDMDSKLENLQRMIRILNSRSIFPVEFDIKTPYLLEVEVIENKQKVYTVYQNQTQLIDLSLLKIIEEFDDNILTKNNYIMSIANKNFSAVKSIFLSGNKTSISPKNDNIISISHFPKGNNWNSLSEMFEILNDSADWIVLRNFENLNDTFKFKKGDDIDILCDDLEFFTALMNAKRRFGGRCSYYVSVNNYNIPLDIRFIGDKYFDPLWASDMLKRKEFNSLIPIPSKFDYFFSLLYHVKLQKISVKNVYIKRLDNFANEINIQSLPQNFVLDDSICADLLNGFLSSNNYRYTYTDDAVRNKSFLEYINLKEINDPLNNWRVLIKKTPQIFFKKITLKFKKIFFKKKQFPKVY